MMTHTHKHTSQDLVEEDLDVVSGERLRRHDHFVEVALHQLRDHVAARRSGVKGNEESVRASSAHTRHDTGEAESLWLQGCELGGRSGLEGSYRCPAVFVSSLALNAKLTEMPT